MIISTPDSNDAVWHLQKLKKEGEKEIVVRAQDTLFNRKILERKDVHILLSPELHTRKDSLKQRDSGLNEHMCRLAKENSIIIGIDVEVIQRLGRKEKAIVLSRIRQNLFLGKKAGCRFIVYPPHHFKKQDVEGFFRVLQKG